MDQPCSFQELRGCLRSIAQVNRITRAYAPTLSWLGRVCAELPPRTEPLHILDVGCGYGDMLRRMEVWAREHRVPVLLTGIDLNPDAIRAAREAAPEPGITFLAGNAFELELSAPADLVVSSLLTHHLEDAEIVAFLGWMERTARIGWFINDLHRQPVHYHFFRLAARFTTWHPFVQHDGPVSILRSFRHEDWVELCRAALIPQGAVEIVESRPARLCVARIKVPAARKTADLF